MREGYNHGQSKQTEAQLIEREGWKQCWIGNSISVKGNLNLAEWLKNNMVNYFILWIYGA